MDNYSVTQHCALAQNPFFIRHPFRIQAPGFLALLSDQANSNVPCIPSIVCELLWAGSVAMPERKRWVPERNRALS